jgi:hypothetical protein
MDPSARRNDRAGQAGQVPARMNPRLAVHSHPGSAGQRGLAHEDRIEAEVGRQLGVALKPIRLTPVGPTGPDVQIAVDPPERAIDPLLPHDLVDPCDRGEPGIPHRLSVRLAELAHQLGDAGVGDHGEVGAGVSSVARGAAAAVQHDHGAAGGGEAVSRGQAGDPRPDHHDVGVGVGVQLGERREWGGGPVWRRVGGSHVSG